jgi:hypothetical protein
MDALVGKYSRPATEQRDPFEEECQELMNPTDHLSMKFAMPPVADVGSLCSTLRRLKLTLIAARFLASRRYR